MDLRRAVGFVIVFYNDLSITNGLSGSGADDIVMVLIIGFTDAHVGQHVFRIGDCHRVGGNVAADDVANLAQRIAVDLTEQRQGFVGNVERQFRLPRGAGLLFPFHALHQQHDKTDADAAEDHRDTNFRDDIQAEAQRGRPDYHQDHGQGLADHAGQNADFPALIAGHLAVNQPRQQTGDDAGDKAGYGGHAVNINQIAVHTGNHPDNGSHPWAKQDPAGHHGDDTHVYQRSFHRHTGPGTEEREQREDGGDSQQLFRRMR